MQSPGTPVRNALRRPIPVAVLTMLALGILPAFPLSFGVDFLPSYTWAVVADVFGLAVGLPLGAALFWFGWKSGDNGSDKLKKGLFIFLAAPLSGFLIARNSVLVGLPMVLALVAGHHVEASFIVVDADDFGSRHCRGALELRDLPLLYSRVCRVSSELRKSVSPGTEVKVTGYGTALGFFVQDISRAN